MKRLVVLCIVFVSFVGSSAFATPIKVKFDESEASWDIVSRFSPHRKADSFRNSFYLIGNDYLIKLLIEDLFSRPAFGSLDLSFDLHRDFNGYGFARVKWKGAHHGVAMTDHSYLSDQPATSVPEPGTLALFSLGLVGLAFTRRKRRKPLFATAVV